MPTKPAYTPMFSLLFLAALCSTVHSQTFHWAARMGSAGWDQGTEVATDGSGNVYATGNFYDTVDFDPGPGEFNLVSKGSRDVYISKLDASGEFLWARQIGGTGWEEVTAMVVDDQGHIYVTGSFLGVTDFDPGPDTFNLTTSSGDIDAYICKFDSAGHFIWAKQLKSNLAINVYDVAVDDSGSVYTTGYFDGISDFDPSDSIYQLTVQAYSDIFVCKLDSGGNFVWACQMGGTQGAVGHAIVVDDKGNVYYTGTYAGTVDFDPGTDTFQLSAPFAVQKMYLSKLDASGQFVWAKATDGAVGYTIALDHAGHLYATGDYGWEDIALNKFDTAGHLIWAKHVGAFIGYSIKVDASDNVYFTGQFFGTRDFDPSTDTFNLTASGSTDSYILKLDASGTLVWVKQLGGTAEVKSRSLALDGQGGIFTSGNFNETADFDPGSGILELTSAGSYDIFLHKLQPITSRLTGNSITAEFQVYPNPTSGNLIIEFDREQHSIDLVLRNMLGQVVATKSTGQCQRVEFPIHAPGGIYLLELTDEHHQKMTVRIVKN